MYTVSTDETGKSGEKVLKGSAVTKNARERPVTFSIQSSDGQQYLSFVAGSGTFMQHLLTEGCVSCSWLLIER